MPGPDADAGPPAWPRLGRVRRRGAILLALLTLGVSAAPAQPRAALRGRVVEASGGAPIGGALVRLEGPSPRTAPTDDGGFFLLADLAAGPYRLRVTAPGYVPLDDTLTLAPGDRRVRGLALTALSLPEMLVEQLPLEGVGATRVSVEALARLPSLAPGGDAGALLAALPGVATFEEGGQLFVRGGEAVHALFLVDGVPLYQPLHATGGLLGVPPGAIAFVDAWPGGAPARLGGRLGAAFEVGLRAGDRQRVRAEGAVSPLLASLQAEGPLVPGHASLLVAGRVQALGPWRTPGTDRRFGLYDGLARVHAFLTPLATLSVTALATGDRVEATTGPAPLRYGWDNRAAGARLRYLPADYPVQTDVHIFTTALDESSDVPRLGTRRSTVNAYGGGIDFRYLLGVQEVGVGFFGTTTHFETETPRPAAAPLVHDEYLTEGGAYAEAVYRMGLLRIEPGVRAHGYPSRRSTPSVEPRLRLSVGTARRRVFAAASLQRQEVAGDVLGAGAADVFVAWRPSADGAPLPSARHAEVGADAQFGAHARAGVAFWHRRLQALGGGHTTARASGAEATVEAARGPLALRLAYGYSLSATRRAPPPTPRPTTARTAPTPSPGSSSPPASLSTPTARWAPARPSSA